MRSSGSSCGVASVLKFSGCDTDFRSLMKPVSPKVKSLFHYEIAVKAVLVLVCVSVALGSVLRGVGAGVGALVGVDSCYALPTEMPIEEVPPQQESPVEAPNSAELPKGEEAAEFSATRLSKRHRHLSSRECRVEQLYARNIHLARRMASAQFEHCFRNGCGAFLRC